MTLEDSLKKVNKSSFLLRKPRQSEITNNRSMTNTYESDSNSSIKTDEKSQVRINTLSRAEDQVQVCKIKFYNYEEIKKKYKVQN